MIPVDRHNGQPFGAGLASPESLGADGTPHREEGPPFDSEPPAEVDPWYPDPADESAPRLTLADYIRHEAACYRARNSAAGDFIAARLDQLAREVGWTHARTPEEHDDRIATWEREVADGLRAHGLSGVADGESPCGGRS